MSGPFRKQARELNIDELRLENDELRSRLRRRRVFHARIETLVFLAQWAFVFGLCVGLVVLFVLAGSRSGRQDEADHWRKCLEIDAEVYCPLLEDNCHALFENGDRWTLDCSMDRCVKVAESGQ